jgi:hypothetical protein
MVLRYDTADPFAIEAVFRPLGHDEVLWCFARELLMEGIDGPVGQGDVRVWPSTGDAAEMLRIALISPDGEALLQVALREVFDFLSHTYALCPRGSEPGHLDLDRVLRELLAS